MTVSLHHIVIDAHDLPRLARFWSQVLDWKILSQREREIVIGTDPDATVGICLMPAGDEKSVKNRVHLDLNPGGDAAPNDREAEIRRILALGARRVDIGQSGTESWTVLADPEGNEFCIVRPKRTLVG
jgi:predicted enzyme related to lactoylglutathione lyase